MDTNKIANEINNFWDDSLLNAQVVLALLLAYYKEGHQEVQLESEVILWAFLSFSLLLRKTPGFESQLTVTCPSLLLSSNDNFPYVHHTYPGHFSSFLFQAHSHSLWYLPAFLFGDYVNDPCNTSASQYFGFLSSTHLVLHSPQGHTGGPVITNTKIFPLFLLHAPLLTIPIFPVHSFQYPNPNNVLTPSRPLMMMTLHPFNDFHLLMSSLPSSALSSLTHYSCKLLALLCFSLLALIYSPNKMAPPALPLYSCSGMWLGQNMQPPRWVSLLTYQFQVAA